MTKRLVDIDDDLLERARRLQGTATIKDTVNTALATAVRGEDRSTLTMEDLQRVGELLVDLRDPEVMARAWE